MLQRMTVGRVKPPRRAIAYFAANLIALVVAVPAVASVEEADRLVEEGKALGLKERYEEALIRFNEAEKAEPRAVHDCYIANAYHRMKRVPETRFWLDRCKARAGGTPPVSWYKLLDGEVNEVLQGGRYALVELEVEPPNAEIRPLTLSADLPFVDARKLWLPLGQHTIEGRLEGFCTEKVSFVLATKTPYPVFMVLRALPVPEPVAEIEPAPVPEKKPDPPPIPAISNVVEPGSAPVAVEIVASPIEPARRSRVWPWIFYGGAAVGAAGAVFGYVQAHSKAEEMRMNADQITTGPQAQYDEAVASVRRYEGIAWVSLGVAVVASGVGTYLLFDDEPETD